MSEQTTFDSWAVIDSWAAIPGYEGLYEVSNTGQVRSLGPRGRIRKLQPHKGGYLSVILWKDNHFRLHLVHRLVAAAFIGPIPDGMEVNHKDGDKRNNRVGNLEYVTRSENNYHAYRMHLREGPRQKTGENHHNAKLTQAQVNEIRSNYQRNSRTNGSVAFARRFGVNHKTVLRILGNEGWRQE